MKELKSERGFKADVEKKKGRFFTVNLMICL